MVCCERVLAKKKTKTKNNEIIDQSTNSEAQITKTKKKINKNKI
jgi:hypothetical protein